MGENEGKLLSGLDFLRTTFQKRSLPKVKSTDSGKLGFLESIRGLAACAVVLSHILVTYYPDVSTNAAVVPAGNGIMGKLFYGLPLGFMASGHFAVVIFFTMSGFVLTYKYFQSRNQADLHRQAAKRYFRLAIPIFFIVFAAYFLIATGAMNSVHEVARLTGSPEAGRIFNFSPDISQAFYDATVGVLVDKNTAFNPVLWTMSVEFLGSFITFGFAALMGGLKKRWLIYVGAIIALSHTYYICFIIGMVLADLVNTTNVVEFIQQRISKFYVYGSLVVVAILASFPYPTGDMKGTFYGALLIPGLDRGWVFQLWHFAAAAILLSAVLVRPEIQRILNNKFLVFIGGLSFAIYLVHYLILHSLGDGVFVALRANHSLDYSVFIAALTTIILTLLVSVIWKKYVDDMSVSISRRFANYILR